MGMVGENLDLLVTSLDLLDSYLLLDAAGILQVRPLFCATLMIDTRRQSMYDPLQSPYRYKTPRCPTQSSPHNHLASYPHIPTLLSRSLVTRLWYIPTCNHRSR